MSRSNAVPIEGFQRGRGAAKFDLESFQMAGLGRRVLIHDRDCGGSREGSPWGRAACKVYHGCGVAVAGGGDKGRRSRVRYKK